MQPYLHPTNYSTNQKPILLWHPSASLPNVVFELANSLVSKHIPSENPNLLFANGQTIVLGVVLLLMLALFVYSVP
jgi:hypothetical protein